jgi:hypothetical protein
MRVQREEYFTVVPGSATHVQDLHGLTLVLWL